MAQLDLFLPSVLTEAAQCPEPVAIHAIRQSLIHLCDKALVWQEQVDSFTTVADESVYDIDAPQGGRVATIVRVRVDERYIGAENPDRVLGMWNHRLRSRPCSYYSVEPEQVTFFPTPDAAYEVHMTVAFAPKRNALTVPDYLYEQYEETIKHGALGRVFSQPSQPWTNAQLALSHYKLFHHLVDVARAEMQKGRVRSNLMVASRPFA